MKRILDGIYDLKDAEGRDISLVFHALPDRKLVAYYKTIKRPMSLFIIKNNLKHKAYKSMQSFIKDCVQITYNARVFNVKESQIYEDAVIIDDYLRAEIEKLNSSSFEEKVHYPQLGPLPDQDDVSMMDEDDVDEDEDDQDQDEDEEEEDPDEEEEDDDDDDDDDRPRKSRRGRPRRAVSDARRKKKEEEEAAAAATGLMEDRRRKRGRPPTVDKPHEHRIKAIMRGVRKSREPRTGRMHYMTFEKLPDPKLYPEYYSQVAEPIALDIIRKNIKRRKYATVEMFLADMNLMFNNAKMFNADGSQVFKDAVILQQLMVQLAEEELKKPDSVYQDPDSNSKTSRLPLDQVEHRGEIYKVGDWIHIANLNDPAKPTIGQIFRIWQASDGQKWINACWYYRPEQTVHRYDKLFYENEVVKSGQYQDHLVDEILEKCFVMFFTKYQRGRPVGIGERSVYCCESRYNETEKTFNKIRTWKACIPDEIRSTDYPMDFFDKLHPLRRVVSPIRHLLPEDAKDDDPIPEAKLGVPNAPPIIGAVYKRPIDPNEPPEQPTPDGPDEDYGSGNSTPRGTAPGTSVFRRQYNSQSMKQNSTPNGTPLGGNRYYRGVEPSSQVPFPTTPSAGFGTPGAAGLAVPGYMRSPMYGSMVGAETRYNPPPVPNSAYKLPEAFQGLLPSKELEAVVKTSDKEVVWFAAPPLWVSNRLLVNRLDSGDVAGLSFTFERKRGAEDEDADIVKPAKRFGHSAKYLAWKATQNS